MRQKYHIPLLALLKVSTERGFEESEEGMEYGNGGNAW